MSAGMNDGGVFLNVALMHICKLTNLHFIYGKSQDNYLIFNYPLSYVYKISIISLCKLLIRLLFCTNIL